MKKELTPRKKQALEMRSRIQNVALELFDKEGFENVSVEWAALWATSIIISRARTSWSSR